VDYDARPSRRANGNPFHPLHEPGGSGSPARKLFKTDAFLKAQPFGNVPAAFGPDGKTEYLSRTAIMRA